MHTRASQRISFGDFELDLRSGELRKNGARVPLPNQPFRILAFLIQQPGTLVTRDELRQELWAEDTFVDFEHSLNAGVRRLREALGDSATSPRFIETVPQRGYRFIAAAEPASQVSSFPTAPALSASASAVGAGAGTVAVSDRPTRSSRKPAAMAALIVLISSLVVMLALLRPSREAAVPLTGGLVRVTSAAGLNTDPAISRDGTLLAYASDRAQETDFDIYVQPVVGGEPVRRTTDPADESEPSFSPDGARLVYSRRDAGLFVMNSLSGEPRPIVRTRWARTPRFSPDGRWISYWTGFPPSVVAGGVPGGLGRIFIVESEGGEPRALATHLASARYPIWSPDSASILFLGEEDVDRASHDWYVIPSAGGTAVKTGVIPALHAAGLRGGLPIPGAWSEKTGMVVFATNEPDSSNVWQIPVSASTGRVAGPPERLTSGTGVERHPVLSESGRIAFASLVENIDIWRVPIEANTGVVTGPPERVTRDAASDRLRTVSEDGRLVSFLSTRTARDEVWIKDLASGRERQVTHAGADEATASPDGARVAVARRSEGRQFIEVVNTGDGLRSLLCDGCSEPGGWSPDGTQLLYAAASPFRLLRYEFASGRATELVTHPSWRLERPRFAPGGGALAFHTANSPNVRQIYVAPIAPDGPLPQDRWVPVVTDHGCHPSWSPDGSLLYHFSFRDGAFCAWVQPVDPVTHRPRGTARAVQHFHQPRLRAASGAGAFNDVRGGYLYMTLTEATGNIWSMGPGRDQLRR